MDKKDWAKKALHNKLDHVILDEELVEPTTQFENEKSCSRNPQNETQTVGPVLKAKLSDSGQVSPQPICSITFLSDIIKEVRIRLKGLDQKTENLRVLKIELEQVNTSITSLAGRLETVETSLATVVRKIESVETYMNYGHKTVKEDLKKNMATVVQKIESVKTFLKDGHKTVKEDLKKNMATVVQKIESVETFMNYGHKTVKEDLKKNMATVVQKINSVETSLNDGHKIVKEDLLILKQGQDLVKGDIYKSTKDIIAVTEKEAHILSDRIGAPLPSPRECSSDSYVNFKTSVGSGMETSLNEGHKTVKDFKENMATVVQKLESVEKFLKDGHTTVKEDLKKNTAIVVQKIESVETSLNNGFKQGQELMTTKLEQSTSEVKDYINRRKREIVAATEKKAHIVKDRIVGPLPFLGKLSFDFYVENFKTLVRSGKNIYSPPWHIDEAKKSIWGCVWFKEKGNIYVWFTCGRHPREEGLQPAPDIKVKATICDVNNKALPDIVLGEGTQDTHETVLPHNGVWGWPLGVTSCDDLISKGYFKEKGYWRGAILFRYDVTVL